MSCLAENLFGIGPNTSEEDIRWMGERINSSLLLMLKTLTPKEAATVKMRLCGQRLTLKEVGKRLGVTPERVRQIEAKALRKMRAWIMMDGKRQRRRAKYSFWLHCHAGWFWTSIERTSTGATVWESEKRWAFSWEAQAEGVQAMEAFECR